jgi:hypothetical protein
LKKHLLTALLISVSLSAQSKEATSKSNVPTSLKEVLETLPLKIGQKLNVKQPCPAGYNLKEKNEDGLPFQAVYWCQSIKKDNFVEKMGVMVVGDLISMINLELNSKNTVVGADFKALNTFANSYNQIFEERDAGMAYLDFNITPAVRVMTQALKFKEDKQASINSIIFESVAVRYKFDPQAANFCPEFLYKKFNGCDAIGGVENWVISVVEIAKASGTTGNSWDGYDLLSKKAIEFVKKAEPVLKQKSETLPSPQKAEVQAFISSWISLTSKPQNWVVFQKNRFKAQQ